MKLSNFDLVKNNLFENLKIDLKQNLLILREQGIGEEVLFSSVYQNIIDKFENIKIEADKRLVQYLIVRLKKIFLLKKVLFKSYEISKFENVVYAGSIVKFFRKRKLTLKTKIFVC